MTFALSDISAGYGQQTILRDVNLVVPSGSVVALLGPNGAGKTTLLRVASGLLKPQIGTVTLEGRPLAGGADQFARAGICHIPEGRGIFRSLTVRENLLLHSPAQRSEAVEAAVEAFPILGQRINQMAGTLSGGEQQMLSLARTYAADPKIVLLDEVSLGLAPKIVDEIFGFLSRLAARGVALLLVEQYVTRALALSDYVFMLGHGRVVFVGEPSELNSEDVFRSYVGADVGSA